MSAWIEVYCGRSVGHLTRAALLRMLNRADLLTAAEGYGIENELVVNAARAHLRLEPSDREEFGIFKLFYRSEPSRPIIIDRTVAPGTIRELVNEELQEHLADALEPGAEQVRGHLGGVREIVGLELGYAQLEDMGIVLADEIARWIAIEGDGYIKSVDGTWWDIDALHWRCIFPGGEERAR